MLYDSSINSDIDLVYLRINESNKAYMKRKRIVIFGIDCLDHYLIHKWDLKNYYALDYSGSHFAGSDLYTPVVWAKFLTGIDVTRYGFNSKRLSVIKRTKSVYHIRYFLTLFGKIIDKLSQRNNRRIKNVSEGSLFDMRNVFSKFITLNNYNKLSLNERIVLKLLMKAAYCERLPKKLLRRTFIYEAMNKGLRVQLIEFPPINDDIYSLIRNMLYFYIDTPPNERQIFLDYVWKTTELTLDILSRRLNEYDLILWYTPYIDIASHMFYKPKNLAYMTRLYTAYKRLGDRIKWLISEIRDSTIILIISDHGYDPIRQDHSSYGYWSFNIEVAIKPHSILDFAPLIRTLLWQ